MQPFLRWAMDVWQEFKRWSARRGCFQELVWNSWELMFLCSNVTGGILLHTAFTSESISCYQLFIKGLRRCQAVWFWKRASLAQFGDPFSESFGHEEWFCQIWLCRGRRRPPTEAFDADVWMWAVLLISIWKLSETFNIFISLNFCIVYIYWMMTIILLTPLKVNRFILF